MSDEVKTTKRPRRKRKVGSDEKKIETPLDKGKKGDIMKDEIKDPRWRRI